VYRGLDLYYNQIMMKKKTRPSVAFKPYRQDQGTLLPSHIGDLISEGHLVRVVSSAIDKLDLSSLLSRYPGGGASSYHPVMMLKVLVYAYCERIYSSRRIAKALRENIHFMWLSGGSRPDFRTIARFRSGRLRGAIEDVFASVVQMLLASGHIQLQNYFVDGTKVEASAGRYTWVWGKATANYHRRLQGQIRDLIGQIDAAEADEQERYGNSDLEELGGAREVTSQELDQFAARINERLRRQPRDREARRIKKKIDRDWAPRLRKYETQRRILGPGRRSYSKTDPDATFMRTKDDHMRNGQLKPGYNVQAGAENQFIVGYSIHQATTDTSCLRPHMDELRRRLGASPERVVADAGYGSEQNYEYLEGEGIVAYVKDNYFHRDGKRKMQRDVYNDRNWPYDEGSDSFSCPGGAVLSYSHQKRKRTRGGHLSHWRIYSAQTACRLCPHKERCCPRYRRKLLWRNRSLDRYRQAARARLNSDEGRRLRARRAVEVETVFAQIKHNMGFRRFMLRGIDKVGIEWGLLSLAHNLKKLASNPKAA
jgi:transposase